MSITKLKAKKTMDIMPIILIFLFVCYPMQMAYLSETSLGKLFFITLIFYYGSIHIVYGLFVCGLVVAYYQLEVFDGYRRMELNGLLQESMEVMSQELQCYPPEKTAEIASYATDSVAALYEYTPFDVVSNRDETFLQGKHKAELMDVFRNEHCRDGTLLHNDTRVRPEFADFVFSEIRFTDVSAKCNPCDKKCLFEITEYTPENRVRMEDNIKLPKSSKEETPIDWNALLGKHAYEPVESMMDDLRGFSERVGAYFSTET